MTWRRCEHGEKLVVGCDTCIARVKWDQETERVAELPVREVTVFSRVLIPDDGVAPMDAVQADSPLGVIVRDMIGDVAELDYMHWTVS